MPAKRRRAWVGFALFGVLAILGLFVLDGAMAGFVLLLALLAFIGACMYALRGQSQDTLGQSRRTGVAGWLGNWF